MHFRENLSLTFLRNLPKELCYMNSIFFELKQEHCASKRKGLTRHEVFSLFCKASDTLQHFDPYFPAMAQLLCSTSTIYFGVRQFI